MCRRSGFYGRFFFFFSATRKQESSRDREDAPLPQNPSEVTVNAERVLRPCGCMAAVFGVFT